MATVTYQIRDEKGNAAGTQTVDESFAPILLKGQTAVITHRDGIIIPIKKEDK